MIRLECADAPLSPVERYGLDVLVDMSRLVRVGDDAHVAEAVALRVSGLEVGAVPATELTARGWGVEVGDGEVRVPRATLRAIGELAGASAEQCAADSDRHGRVPSRANALVAGGVERTPLVNGAALSLRHAAIRAAGRRPVWLLAPWPDGHRWAAALTHDIDAVSWWPLFSLLRVAELGRKRRWRLAARTVAAAATAAATDPVTDAVGHILEVERRHGVRATWFALCGTPTPSTMARGDLTYRPESRRARRILRRLVDAGHEVGLHGSFATWLDSGTMAGQRRRLAQLTAADVPGVRQHYLRMRPGRTQTVMSGAGFRYDATFGFPDRNGFRLGTADVVPAWDASAGVPLRLSEVPLVWMDRAMSKYSGIESPAAWVDDALALAAICREAEGLWVGLWHPNLTDALGYPDSPREFERLVESLAAEAPYFDTLSGLVEWRSLRRNVRAVALRADGGVELRGEGVAAEGADGHLVLERPARH